MKKRIYRTKTEYTEHGKPLAYHGSTVCHIWEADVAPTKPHAYEYIQVTILLPLLLNDFLFKPLHTFNLFLR